MAVVLPEAQGPETTMPRRALISRWLSIINSLPRRKNKAAALPSDMSTTSLVGGGLIAGDALAALGLGLIALAGLVVG